MSKQNRSWKIAAGVSSTIMLTSAFTAYGMTGVTPVLYAAEQKAGELSEDEAIQKAQKWVTIPADYKQDRAMYLEAGRSPFDSRPSWRITWEKPKAGGIHVIIDAITGKLMQYYSYSERNEGLGEQKVSEEQALANAKQFLLRVTTEKERENLSNPNQFEPMIPYYADDSQVHVFSFTRLVNNTPFLENGFQLRVNRNGEIISFNREWYDGSLPSADQVISAVEATKELAKRAVPSLVYKQRSAITRSNATNGDPYMLVYHYDQTDPQLLDATTGEILNALGQPAEEGRIKPLGTTISAPVEEKIINQQEAEKIAQQLIKKLPGTYRFNGHVGGGGSTGPDGIERRNWRFEFTPVDQGEKPVEPVQLRVGDRGQLVEYTSRERSFLRESGRKWEKAVSWEQAEASAIQLVNIWFADRLGEIYLLPEKPSDTYVKNVLEKGGYYEVNFGWMKNGVPIENARFEVLINPETGIAESLNMWMDERPIIPNAKTDEKVDAETAKKAEQEHRFVTLTYYQPLRGKMDDVSPAPKPLLVYRYVGDQGVIDARTGEWISFAEMRKKQAPTDIEKHPQKDALEWAVQMDFLSVTEGKLEPDKQVTRGEMAKMMARMTERIEFHYLSESSFDDEEDQPYHFADADQKHPLYAAIQKSVQFGLIAKEGNRFEPDRAITRAEAADMVARLLGYADLLNKPEIFASAYQDVQKKQLPAVALVHAHALLSGKTSTAFEPNASLTRADAAQLMKALIELKEEKE